MLSYCDLVQTGTNTTELDLHNEHTFSYTIYNVTIGPGDIQHHHQFPEGRMMVSSVCCSVVRVGNLVRFNNLRNKYLV